MEIKRNRIKIGHKEHKDYLNAAVTAFENYDEVELSASGEGKVIMNRLVYQLCNLGVSKVAERTEHIKGSYDKDDFYPRKIITLRKPITLNVETPPTGGLA